MADETILTAQAETGEETTSPDKTNLDAMIVDDFAALIHLNGPEAGQTQEVLLTVGDIVRMDFDIDNQTLVLDGNDLRIEFDNSAVIVLNNFVSLSDQVFAPMITMPDGAMIPGDVLLTAMVETPVETAAGEAAASGGAGEYRADMGDILNGIDKLGVQDPDAFGATTLQAQEDEQTPLLPENQLPDAVDDLIQVDEDDSVTFNLLDNDTDPDGDTLVIIDHTEPKYAELIDNGDGSFTYTPEPGYNGEDSFEYTIDDGQGGTDTGIVSIVVDPINDNPVAQNDPPGAGDDRLQTPEDQPITADVLTNDSDPDGDELTIVDVAAPEHGSVVINDEGTITYTPDPNYSGPDSFEYTIDDGQGGTDTAAVYIDVTPVNDLPVTIIVDDRNDPPDAADNPFTTPEDTALVINTSTIIANDTDVEDGTPEFNGIVTGPTHGTLDLNPDGTYTYTPDQNYNGEVSFVYEVIDSDGATA